MIKTVTLSSLSKVFPESCPHEEVSCLSALKNEPLSFQVAYKADLGNTTPFYVTIDSPLPISFFTVGYVPVLSPNNSDYTEKYRPGLFPDILYPKEVNPEIVEISYPWQTTYTENGKKMLLRASSESWQSLWFTINEDALEIPCGEYEISGRLMSRMTNEQVGSFSLCVKIIDKCLPKQELICTNWFYCDCIADIYGVEVYSEEFWEIFKSFVRAAAKNGMNMILTPAFTPSLDTPIGRQRMNVQLVKVKKVGAGYEFDFSMLKRFIDICKDCGIEYFEHCHLFSQWGSKYAITIMADGEVLFGWDTDAADSRYVEFLRTYLAELKKFLIRENINDKILFHISDEPTTENAEGYKKAKTAISDLIEGYMTGDALCEYEFYEDKTVETPIVSTIHIDKFIGKCDNLWAYYTGEAQKKLSNRLIINSSERNRMLGVQMYYHNIKGFLHWGYNFYYDILSSGIFDPRTNPEGFGGAGTCFLVYPGNDKTALQSMRQKVFAEAILDIRALNLLESLAGRDAACELIEKHFGKVTFETEVKSVDAMLAFRREVNEAISKL